MKCQNCQTEYYDTYAACPACAAPNPAYQTECASFGQTARYPSAVELIKEVGKSKLLLIAAILYTISCAISFISSDGIPVLEVLVTVGLWLFYADSKKPTADPYVMNTTPLTLIKISQNIEYVLCWIGAVACAVSFLVMLFVPNEVIDSVVGISGLIGIVSVVLIITTVVLAAEIIIKKGILDYLKSVLESAKTGLRPKKLPKYTPYLMIAYSVLSVIFFIAALFAVNTLLDTLSTIVNPMLSVSYSYFGIQNNGTLAEVAEFMHSPLVMLPNAITMLIPIVANVLFAKILLDAKKHFDSAYYPTPEELFYQKQEYYNAKAAYDAQYANQYAQYQQPYGQGYPQNQYGQPYQPYAQQPNVQPPQNEPAQTPADSEKEDNT